MEKTDKPYLARYYSSTTLSIKSSGIYTADTFHWSSLSNAIMVDIFAQHHFTTIFKKSITSVTIDYNGLNYDYTRHDGIINNVMLEVKQRYDIDSGAYNDCMGEEDKRLALVVSSHAKKTKPCIMFTYNDGYTYLFDLSKPIRLYSKMMWVPKFEGSDEYIYKLMTIYDKRDAIIFQMHNYNKFMKLFMDCKNKYKPKNILNE